ncbi:MAG: formate dehydrogenase accessory protein FdhE [Planctomycetota bacterium]
MNPWPHKPDVVIASLDKLTQHKLVPESYVLLRVAILRAQTAIAESLVIKHNSVAQASCLQSNPSKSLQPAKILTTNGISALSLPLTSDAIAFKGEMLQQLLAEIHDAINLAGGKSLDVDRIIAGTSTLPGLLEELTCRIGWRADEAMLSQVADQLAVERESVLWTARNLAAPFLTAATMRISDDAQPANDNTSTCPICASLPSLAKLRRNDGGRMLFCGLCGATWAFARAECPFCRRATQWERLADEQDVHWLETCGDCQYYLKTIDERKLAAETLIIPLAQDVATLHLDILAEREGLHKPPLYVALW